MAKLAHIYHFERKLAENRFCVTWVAAKVRSGEPCVVKIASRESGSDVDQTNRFLTSSFLLQRPLHYRGILRASSCVVEDGLVCVEYPYLDAPDWHPLTPAYFRQNFVKVLTEICLAVDYLHVLGLVHGDLKLENFLVHHDSKRLVLVDLDFLCREDMNLNATIFGTKDHIAPEMTAEELVAVQSDNFALGVSLGRFLDALGALDPCPESETELAIQRLKLNLGRLTIPNHIKRPRILLDFLAEAQVISREELERAERILAGSFFLTRVRSVVRKRLSDEAKLDRFIHEECRLFGFSQDAINLLAKAIARSRSRAFHAVVALMTESELVRHSDSWHTNPPLHLLGEFYEQLEAIVADGARSPDPEILPTEWLQKARDLALSGDPERSLLCYHRIIEALHDVHTRPWPVSRLELFMEAGQQAERTDRTASACKYFEESLKEAPGGSIARLRLLAETAAASMKMQAPTRADELIAEGLQAEETEESRPFLLKLRRLRSWRRMFSSDYDFARKELLAVAAEARQYQIWETEALAVYSLGVLEHRQGNLQDALRLFSEALEIARSRSLTAVVPPIATMLATTQMGLTRYSDCVKYADLAVAASQASHSSSVSSALYHTLSGAYMRLGMYPKAYFWFERSRRCQAGGLTPVWLQSNWVNEAAIQFQEGDLQKAETSLRRALELGHIPSFSNLSKACFLLAEIYIQTGRFEKGRESLQEARQEMLALKDNAGPIEVELQEVMIKAQQRGSGLSEELVRIVPRLLDHSRMLFTTIGILQLLLLDEKMGHRFLNDMDTETLSFLTRSGHPLMEAVQIVSATIRGDSSFAERADAWKRAFSILMRSHHYFWAVQIAIHLGDLYMDEQFPKQSRKFYRKGADVSLKLPNQLLEARALSGLKRADEASGSLAGLISSFVSISKILKDVSDFRGSLRRLIRFAVEQTGAERGVLLLKSPDSPGLQVVAAVNCDDQSIDDVLAFSSKLPDTAFREALPVVIEDATVDERTKSYKSVVVHNILSVVCLPLVDGSETLGVLYLDHHSIPALFEPDDLQYIESIANFLTVFLVTAQEFRHLSTSQTELLSELNRLGVAEGFITRYPKMLRLVEQLPQIARTSASVLLLGESGTGKELLCNMVHKLSLRAKKPLKKLNCASIPHDQMESELFGVAKNAFTGVAGREGKFEAADGGTLFFDEIGDMPLELQSKLLRVVEYQEFERVGGNELKHVDLRFIYATNRDLHQMVADGKFRQDLLYRITTIAIEVPPLRHRLEDIPLMIDYYIKVFSVDRPAPRISPAAMDKLVSYPWPGNARELRNVIERTCILHPGERIDPSMLPKEISSIRTVSPSRNLTERAEAAAIREALILENWVESRAAKRLGMPLTTLRRKIKKYHIRRDE